MNYVILAIVGILSLGVFLLAFKKTEECSISSGAPLKVVGRPREDVINSSSAAPVRYSAPSASSCWWVFDSYVPSTYEVDWIKGTTNEERNPCGRFSAEAMNDWDSYWKKYHSQKLCTTNNGCPPIVKGSLGEKPKAPAIFSHFRYKKLCGNEAQGALLYPAPTTGAETYDMVIEPLAGVLRHPRYCVDGGLLVDKNYMFCSDPWLISMVDTTPIRFYYFDAGASTWTDGAGGASQSWIVTEFASRWCMEVSGIWGWEVGNVAPVDVFKQLPKCLPPVYHWFNIPVETDKTSSSNIWRHVEQIATPQDFVVVKIDIDNSPIETLLLKELTETPSLQRLVDEMFFEHHANFGPICGAWGTCGSDVTYLSSLKLFSTLRQAGVRIHSWV